MNRYKLFALLCVVFVSGCAPKANRVCGEEGCRPQEADIQISNKQVKLKPYQFKLTPIVGTRHDESKVIVDMGKIQKIWIKQYKVGSTLIPSHDIFTWVVKPDYVVGESVPTHKNNSGLLSPMNRLPFALNAKEISSKEKRLTNSTVKKYVNSLYQTGADPQKVVERNKKADSEYDSVINEYLRKKRSTNE